MKSKAVDHETSMKTISQSACPDWLRQAVMYEIYIPSFYDGNGDGIGDLEGIIQKLDYLQKLGCNLLWLSPCFDSAFRDGGYDIVDYYKVAPRYGTNDDMARLFREAAKRGIRICLDLVVGHTSVDHPWFKESCKPEPNKYSNWYIWTDSWLSFSKGSDLRLISGYTERNGCFAVNFFYSQPALNHGFANPDPDKPWQLPMDHPDVKALREEIKNIVRFWLDIGASGFRCDMASSMVKEDPDRRATAEFWREIRTMLNEEYPEAVLISEWGAPPDSIPAGFHVDFLSPHIDPAENYLFRSEEERNILMEIMSVDSRSFFDRHGEGDVTKFLTSFERFYRHTQENGFISIPTGNHDMARISVGRTHQELEVVFAFLMTMPTIPLVYYGDEIGMPYQRDLISKEGGYTRTGSRTPMQWAHTENAGFSSAPVEKLYLPIATNNGFTNVAQQIETPSSLLNQIKRMIALRHETPALWADADFRVLYAEPQKYPFVYMREHDQERILVAVNPSERPVSITVSLPSPPKNTIVPLMKQRTELRTDGAETQLDMQGISYGIFKF